MSRRTQFVLLAGLLLVLVAIVYFTRWSPTVNSETFPVIGNYIPMNVDSPKPRTDLLARSQKVEYNGTHRDIFRYGPPPHLQGQRAPIPAPVKLPEGPPPGPPPLQVPVKFFGYAADPHSGSRRAFLAALDGGEVFIVSEGDTLMSRFRVVRINNGSAEFEELGTGRRASLPLEEGGPQG